MIAVIPNLGFRFVEQAKKEKKSLCVLNFVSGTLNFLHLFQKILKQQRVLIIYQKRCQTGVMVYEQLSTLHELSNLENHLKMFSVWLYQSPHHIVVEGLWPTLVYSVGSAHCLCTGLLRPTTAFSHDMVWTLTFLFFNHSVLYFLFCGHCPAAVLEKLVTASVTTRYQIMWLQNKTSRPNNILCLFIYNFFMWIYCDIKPWVSILNIIHLWIIVLTAEWQMGLLEMAFNPSQINGQQKSLPRVNGFLPQHCVDFLSSENMNKNKSNYKYWLLYYTLCYSSYYLSNKMIFVTRPVKHWSFFMHSQIWWHAGIFESERQSISYLTKMVDVCLNHESL